METSSHIMIIEDEVVPAMLLQKQLIKAGYPIETHFTTGEAAIAAVKKSKPDLIIMDIGLAGALDGIETASLIKAESDIPVIFLTCYDDRTIRERAQKIDPLAFLIKPVEIQTLIKIIDSLKKPG